MQSNIKYHITSQLKPSSPQRPMKSGVSRWASYKMCGVEEEEVRAGSLEAWWCVSDQSNAVPKRACCKMCAERCKCLISWLPFLSFHLCISCFCLLCQSACLSLSSWCIDVHSLLQHEICVRSLCTVKYRMWKMCAACMGTVKSLPIKISLKTNGNCAKLTYHIEYYPQWYGGCVDGNK